jgi:hypothetical protein
MRHGRHERRATAVLLAAGVAAALASQQALADDSDGSPAGQGQNMLQLMKQMQAFQTANGDQQMQQGFQAGETLLTLTGQPEFAAGLKLLEGVLDFTGVFGSAPSGNAAQSQALATLAKNLAEVNTEVTYLQSAVLKLATQLADQSNKDKLQAIVTAQTLLGQAQDKLYPNSHVLNPSGSGLSPNGSASAAAHLGGGGAGSQPVDRATAGTVASDVRKVVDPFVDAEALYFIADDLQIIPAVYGPRDPTGPANNPRPLITPAQPMAVPGLKPNPALATYLFGLQLWITAMEIESQGSAAGHTAIVQSNDVQTFLRKHVAFLSSRANGGRDPNGASTIQDQIIQAVSCQWNVHGGTSGGYPDRQGNCSATLSCQDNIAHTYPKIPPVSITWTQRDQNSLCMLDPNAQTLSGGVGINGKPLSRPTPFPSDLARQMENVLQQQYGLMAMDRMAAMLEQIALYGTAVGWNGGAPSSVATGGGNFGGKSDAPYFVFGVDASGNVKSYVGYGNQPVPQPTTAGTIANLKAFIPGGDKTFYGVTADGKLNWYRFSMSSGGPKATPTTVSAPVNVAQGFNAYRQVFGGSDGVIYGVRNDGTLVWYRHAGFANGGGPTTMSGPKDVATGFGQYKQVFSAGSGIIYAIASDGSLFWYRHKNYLTGAPDAPSAPPAKAVPTANAKSAVGAQKIVAGAETAHMMQTPSQLEGPVLINSGWAGFRQVIPAGNGVILAVQGDGTLIWYRHDDYLTGVSATPQGGKLQQTAMHPMEQAGSGPQWGSPAAGAAAHGTTAGQPAAPNWGSPGQSAGGAGAQHAGATPQWGSAQPQAHAIAPTAMTVPSSLQGATTRAGGASPTGAPGPGIPTHANAAAATGGAMHADAETSHWEGPATIGAHSGWEGFAEVAAILPLTVQTNAIK